MTWIFGFLRIVLLAVVLSLCLAWLRKGDGDLALTLSWTLYPVSGGMVAARSLLDWEATRRDAQLLAGVLRVAAFFAVVAVAQWGFPGSLTAVSVAFVTTLTLACYRAEA
jgi:hypothetical protein